MDAHHLRRLSWLTAMILLASPVVLVSEVAADTCSASSHGGCNGHSCGTEGETHNHKTLHWWAKHFCKREPTKRVGAPRTTCDSHTGDRDHEYGPSTGFVLAAGTDGALDCENLLQGDGHFEFALGGAWLLACEASCGGDGGGSFACWGTTADHAAFPEVVVYDQVLSSFESEDDHAGNVAFQVSADLVNNVPPLDPNESNCGDFEDDMMQDCVDSCFVTFPPGLDGSYAVYVSGTSGSIYA